MINLCPSEGQRQGADNGNIKATRLVEPDSGDASLTVRWTPFSLSVGSEHRQEKGTCVWIYTDPWQLQLFLFSSCEQTWVKEGIKHRQP